MQLVVGRIVRPHGIRGEVLVDVRTDEPDERFAVGSALTTDATAKRPQPVPAPEAPAEPVRIPERLTIESVRWHQARLLVVFEGVSDRDVAEALRGVLLCVDSADVAPPADPDEFHDHQLVGLTAVTPAGERLGEVTGVDHAPASDLLVLRRTVGGTALVPFVKAIVPAVDLANGRVVVDPPAGLLDL
jgi:16S rRNA processing protein RimM